MANPSSVLLSPESALDSFAGETQRLLIEHHALLRQDDAKRKGNGVVYTPSGLVAALLSLMFDQAPALSSGTPSLLDPSCGTGNFLVEAYRRLVEVKQIPPTAAARIKLLRDAVFGCDVDAQSLEITKRRLWQAALEGAHEWVSFRDFPHANFITGDALSLVSDDDPAHLLPGLGQRPWIAAAFDKQFDFVVGNPPYGKIGLSQGQRQYFAESIYGHANTYGVFLHLGVVLLKPQGRLGYVVPASMLSGLYFQNLRRFLTERCRIHAIVQIDQREKVFDSVLQEVMLLVLESGKHQETEPVRLTTVTNEADLLNIAHGSSLLREVPLSSVVRESGGYVMFHVPAQDGTESVYEKYEDIGVPLADARVGYVTKTGPIVWNRLKPFLRDEANAETLPLIWSNNVGYFSFEADGNREHKCGHLLLNERTQPLVTSGECVVVQRTTAKEQRRRIIGAFPATWQMHTAAFFVENHLNILVPIKDAHWLPPEYVLGLLNSRLFDFIFRTFNGNTQVSATELNVMRFAVPDSTGIADVVNQVRLLQYARRSVANSEFLKLVETLDRIVYGLYGLSPEEIERIQSQTQKPIA